MTLDNIPIGGAGMLMRTSIMKELGGFDPEFFHCSDLELFVRFFQHHDGWILPYRVADADQPEDRLTAPSEDNRARFQADIDKLHKKHTMDMPSGDGRITVGIPIHNMAETIGATLYSLSLQTHKDFDLIILDDASTDDLQAALEKAPPNTRFLKFEENMGVRHAVNTLLANCKTEFFVSLAADDVIEQTYLVIEQTYLEKALKCFHDNPWLEFVASQTSFCDKDDVPLPAMSHDVQKIERAANKTREQWLERLYMGNVYFGVGMYRAEAARQVGGWNVDDGVLTDYDMYLRLLHRGNIHIIEEDLTMTRIWEKNASVGEGKLDPVWLREKYAEIRKRYYAPRIKCIIATPFYEMRGFSPYIYSLFYTAKLMQQLNIQCEFWELSGDSYVDRAKNTLFNKFLEDPEATDLFMVDSDMQWNPDAMVKMLMLPDPILVGSYPQKNSWERWTSIPEIQAAEDGKHRPIGRELGDGSAVLKATHMAGGFVRIKRQCLEMYKAKYTEDTYQDISADPSAPNRIYTNFFQCEVRDGLRWGEDRFFGRRLKEIGIEPFIFPNIEFGHYGVKGWFGNLDRYLRNPEKQQDYIQSQQDMRENVS
jgi:glycosyltransferase involved in cell wall biosynthesis